MTSQRDNGEKAVCINVVARKGNKITNLMRTAVKSEALYSSLIYLDAPDGYTESGKLSLETVWKRAGT